MRTLTIGQVARLAGVGIETVRFYEREELIAAPPRSLSGYRQYPAETVSRLRFIRRAKALGFSLQEVRELLALQVRPGASSGEVKARAEAKITDIEARIRTFQRLRDTLVRITAACDGCAPVSACPILDAIEAQDNEPER
jgi:MerR family mercuric resistance operon transcriptional regulator